MNSVNIAINFSKIGGDVRYVMLWKTTPGNWWMSSESSTGTWTGASHSTLGQYSSSILNRPLVSTGGFIAPVGIAILSIRSMVSEGARFNSRDFSNVAWANVACKLLQWPKRTPCFWSILPMTPPMYFKSFLHNSGRFWWFSCLDPQLRRSIDQYVCPWWHRAWVWAALLRTRGKKIMACSCGPCLWIGWRHVCWVGETGARSPTWLSLKWSCHSGGRAHIHYDRASERTCNNEVVKWNVHCLWCEGVAGQAICVKTHTEDLPHMGQAQQMYKRRTVQKTYKNIQKT